ncbi:MAG: nickel pincer cofactor biosynthesis protein LarC [Vicinamibacterales bacterium]
MKILYFDCFSGAAGDMVLGSLIDAGVPLGEIRRALGTLAIEPEAVWTDRVVRAGVTATKFCVREEAERRHPHRHLTSVYALIDGSALSEAGKARAKTLVERLGEAEAAIHGTTMEQVHLHEVGALDSIIDIVGSVFALEWLGADAIVSSPLNVGSGTVRVAHGLYPVPAPATLRLLEGVPVYAGTQQAELVTPTGALLVSSYATSYGPVPAMTVKAIGYGAGTRDFGDTPNVLRVLVGEADTGGAPRRAPDPARSTTVVVIESEIDDMNPQIFGVLMDRLLADGALDVFYTPVQMKKNRPGTLLTIIAPPEARERLVSLVFAETTSIGVRYREMTRECLERETIAVETPLGAVRIKVARRGAHVLNAAPEFEDCVRLARQSGRPVKDVQAMAAKAYLERT